MHQHYRTPGSEQLSDEIALAAEFQVASQVSLITETGEKVTAFIVPTVLVTPVLIAAFETAAGEMTHRTEYLDAESN